MLAPTAFFPQTDIDCPTSTYRFAIPENKVFNSFDLFMADLYGQSLLVIAIQNNLDLTGTFDVYVRRGVSDADVLLWINTALGQSGGLIDSGGSCVLTITSEI